MSSRCRASAATIAALALLSGCDREERHSRPKPATETVPLGAESGALAGGELPQLKAGYRRDYERNANAIAQGQRWFVWMNCVGCHANGGGGMGPPLMDDEWRYGGRIDQIAATIVNGRPNGMPSFRDKLTAEQVWQLAAYVRALSGQVRKDAIGGRTDSMSSLPPLSEKIEEPVRREDFGDQ